MRLRRGAVNSVAKVTSIPLFCHILREWMNNSSARNTQMSSFHWTISHFFTRLSFLLIHYHSVHFLKISVWEPRLNVIITLKIAAFYFGVCVFLAIFFGRQSKSVFILTDSSWFFLLTLRSIFRYSPRWQLWGQPTQRGPQCANSGYHQQWAKYHQGLWMIPPGKPLY